MPQQERDGPSVPPIQGDELRNAACSVRWRDRATNESRVTVANLKKRQWIYDAT